MAAAQSTFEALKQALEGTDIDALMELYDDDAVQLTYSERSRPSSAEPIRGKAGIEAVWREIEKRNLQETISDEVIGDDRFSFALTCRYPTGELVFGAYVCELRDGKIVRQTGAETWDE